MDYNRVILAGRITRDIEISFTPQQTQVCEFGLAINKKWTTKGGEKKEKVCFIECNAFGKTAELIGKYFSKGKGILVEGELDFSTWEKNHVKFSKHRVQVREFKFVDDAGNQQQAPPQQQKAPPQQQFDPNHDDGTPF